MNGINQIKTHIADFCKEGYIENEQKDLLMSLAKQYSVKTKDVEQLIDAELSSVKLLQVEKLFKTLDQPVAAIRNYIDCESQGKRQFPDLINFGKLRMTGFDNEDAMALLPTKDLAGICFLHSGNEKEATAMMQNIAVRIALCLPAKKVKFTLVDVEQSGLAFSYLSGLDEELYSIIDSTKQLEELFETMVKVSSSFIFKELGNKYENYHDYFLANKNTAKPYHIVLINGINGKISEEMLPNFIKLIKLANKSGLFFLLAFDSVSNNSIYSHNNELQACLTENMFVYDSDDNTYKASDQLVDLWYNKVYQIEHTKTIEFDDFHTAWINFEFDPIKHKKPSKAKQVKPQPEKESIHNIVLPIGLNSENELYEWKFDDKHEDSLILSSDSISKHTIFHHLIYLLATNYSPSELKLRFFGITRETYELVQSLPQTETIVTYNSPVFLEGFIQDLFSEINRRKELFKNAPVKVLGYSEYRKVTSENLPRIFVMIQDFDKTTSLASDFYLTDIIERLSRLMMECNGYGIHFIIFSEPDEKFLSLDLNQFEYRFFIKSDGEKSKLFANLSSTSIKSLSENNNILIYSDSDKQINNCILQPKEEKVIKEELSKIHDNRTSDIEEKLIINTIDTIPHSSIPSNNAPLSDDGTINIYIGQSLWYTKETQYLLTLPKKQSPNVMISGKDINANISFILSTLKQLGEKCDVAIFDVSNSITKEKLKLEKANKITDTAGFLAFVDELKEKTERIKMNPGIVSQKHEPLIFFVLNVDKMYGKDENKDCFQNLDYLLQNSNELNVRVVININNNEIFDDDHLSVLSKYTFGTNIICKDANENLLSPITTMDNKIGLPKEDYVVLIETENKKSEFSADPVKLYNL